MTFGVAFGSLAGEGLVMRVRCDVPGLASGAWRAFRAP